jgi:O-antigen/teichoic acid export membrane protein
MAIALQLIERITWLFYIPAIFFGLEKIATYVLPILLGLAIHGFFGTFIIVNDMKERLNHADLNSNVVKAGYITTKDFGMVSIVSDIGNLDGVLVAQLSSFSEAGNYNLAVRFRNPALMSFQAFATRMRPVVAKREKSEIRKLFKDNFRFNSAGVFSLLLLAILCSFSSGSIFGDSFVDVNILLAITILSAIPTGFSIICGSFLNSVGSESFVAKSTIIYTVTGLTGTGISAFYSGSLGAVIFNLTHSSIICGVFASKSLAEYQRL